MALVYPHSAQDMPQSVVMGYQRVEQSLGNAVITTTSTADCNIQGLSYYDNTQLLNTAVSMHYIYRSCSQVLYALLQIFMPNRALNIFLVIAPWLHHLLLVKLANHFSCITLPIQMYTDISLMVWRDLSPPPQLMKSVL